MTRPMFSTLGAYLIAFLVAAMSAEAMSIPLERGLLQPVSAMSPQLQTRQSTGLPTVGQQVGTFIQAFGDTNNCGTSTLNFNFQNPGFGVCYSLVSGGSNIPTASMFTDANYDCGDPSLQPAMLFFTSDFACNTTITDIGFTYLLGSTTCRGQEDGSQFKGFKLGCALVDAQT